MQTYKKLSVLTTNNKNTYYAFVSGSRYLISKILEILFLTCKHKHWCSVEVPTLAQLIFKETQIRSFNVLR